ncbi:MAG: LysR family transcriptional regulator [Chloroflexi bacterium]|nr:LysR family transcriptional regulator [Chloroflexota bacterium]
MEIRYLKDFIVVAETRNFLEAASILYCSQATLSKHIQRLELDLGLTLFDRTTRRVTITKFGEMLLPYAREITEIYERFSDQVKDAKIDSQQTLTIGSIPALAQYNITDLLVALKKFNPQATINVIQSGSEELADLVRQKKCDLAFIRTYGEFNPDFNHLPYAVDELVAILPSSHPLAGQSSVQLYELRHENFVLIPENTMLHRLSKELCQASGFEPNVVFTDHRLENLMEMVVKGMGIALLMRKLAEYMANPKVSVLSLEPTVSTRVDLCYLKNTDLSPVAKAFVKITEDLRSPSHI